MKSILASDDLDSLKRVYSPEIRARLTENAGLLPHDFSGNELRDPANDFSDVEIIFSTWGMPTLHEEEITRILPSLRCVFYAAGSVQYFARPFLNCGVRVFTAAEANAVPVAEYTAAQIILANKGFFRCVSHQSRGDLKRAHAYMPGCPGNYRAKVGLLGAGAIGRRVIARLKEYDLVLYVFDPFLPDECAEAMGVKKCSLEEIFRECILVSNHLANNERTKGMLTGAHFSSMPEYATFLNTGRGAQVVEAELAEVLAARPDLTAILDVTDPEPPHADSPFFTLDNCILTPHIAGSSGDEVGRMAEYMAEEFDLWNAGKPVRYEVTVKMLETMA